MTGDSPRLRQLLSVARDDAPSPADRARIAEKLAARIALVDAGASRPPEAPSPAPGAPAPVEGATATGGAGVVVAGGVLLAVGIAAVLSLGRGDTIASGPHASAASPLPVAVTAPTAELDDRPSPAAAPSTADAPATGDPTREVALDGTPADERRTAAATASATPASRSRSAAPSTPSPAPGPRASSLAEELALLRDARAAARGDDPARSLALLDELDRRHPDGVLHEERRAARVVALCAAGDPAASAEAARFLRELPSSVHAARVRAACPRP